MVLGGLNLLFRDVGQAFCIVATFWFLLSPIVYAPTILRPLNAKAWADRLMGCAAADQERLSRFLRFEV